MLAPNVIINGTYRVEREIGQGGLGQVYLAWHMNLEKQVVIKRIRGEVRSVLPSRREVDILKNLSHSRLPQVYDFLRAGDEIYTVMDYIPGKSLEDVIREHRYLPQKQLEEWLREMLEVLEYLHTRKPPIIHCDIKPANIILTRENGLVLIDFNISMGGPQAQAMIGYSQFYASPEQVRLVESRGREDLVSEGLDGRSDLYSLAAVFYHLITQRRPSIFQPNPPLRQIGGGRYSPYLLDILDRAMQPDPDRRWRSAKAMHTALDRARWRDRGMGGYLVMQGVSLLAAAILVGAGLFCMVRGFQTGRYERYQADYALLTQAVSQGDDDAIYQAGTSLLNSSAYQNFLDRDPETKSAVLHAVGDCCYNREDYVGAATYYREAVACAEPTDPNLGTYYCDQAVALAMEGRSADAAALVTQAAQAGVQDAQMLLIQATASMTAGDLEACITSVSALTNLSDDPALCARACLVAAQMMEGTDKLVWLQTADSYQRSQQVLRQLGSLCVTLSDSAADESSAQRYLQMALEYYEALCGYNYATLEDRLNLSVVQLSLEESGACIENLADLYEMYPEDYRIEMNLAFAYAMEGQTLQASAYTSRALEHWEALPDTDRDPDYAQAIENLRQLQLQLNNW